MIADPFFDSFKTDVERKINDVNVVGVHHSNSVYFVETSDSKDTAWVFFRFKGNKVVDSFLTLDLDTPLDNERHLIKAYQHIMVDGRPYHERYEKSFLTRLLFELGDLTRFVDPEINDSTLILNAGQSSIQCVFKDNDLMTTLKEQFSNSLDESSVKYMALSQGDRSDPKSSTNPRVKFEFCFLSELAKYLFTQQFDAITKETLAFLLQSKPFKLNSQSVELTVCLSFKDLNMLINSLVDFDPSIVTNIDQKRVVESIRINGADVGINYANAELAELKSVTDELDSLKQLTETLYTNGEEIFAKSNGDVKQNDGMTIYELIDEIIIEPLLLQKLPIEYESNEVDLNFHLEMATTGLKITPYMIVKGDLDGEFIIYKNWLYVPNKGLYKLHPSRFNDDLKKHHEIPLDELSNFIRKNKVFLSSQDGFQCFDKPFCEDLSYSINDKSELSFHHDALAHNQTSNKDAIQFSNWIYIGGYGFFPNEVHHMNSVLYHGLTIQKQDVADFLSIHESKLLLVSNFWYTEDPVEEAFCELSYLDGILTIEKHVMLKHKYANNRVLFFDIYVYVKNCGFYCVDTEKRLPDFLEQTTVIKDDELDYFLSERWFDLLPLCKNVPVELTIPEKFDIIITDVQRSEGQLDDNQFILNFSLETNFGKITIKELMNASSTFGKYVPTKVGLINVKDVRFEVLSKFKYTKTGFKGSTIDIARLHSLSPLKLSTKTMSPSRKAIEDFLSGNSIVDPDINGLKSVLRTYQHNGLVWLWYLYTFGLSGILCDDMGLGKTHQAMALMTAIKNMKGSRSRFLVVCPTSVLYHWKDKIKEFAPDINFHVYHGSDRNKKELDENDAIITSYGILRRDCKYLSIIGFDLIVFDEIQMVKNVKSQLYQVSQCMNSKMFLGMTGTPIENTVKELKNLFDLVLPGYLPSDSKYFNDAKILLDKRSAENMIIKKMISPFVLRRIKEDVLSDLPEKIEEISHCQMTPDQKGLYNQILQNYRESLMPLLIDGSKVTPYFHIFSVLNALKQICDHPNVYFSNREIVVKKKYESGKWNLFVDLLNQSLECGKKIVVFSQYLAMLDIIENYLKEIGVSFSSLRGSTRNRESAISRFQKDETCQVFVASLNAAGVGIDLTSASVVILYDRWWNAARENQAIDRVHRIGQNKGVQVFKLVTLNSIEERIDQLINKKKHLLSNVVTIDEASTIKMLSKQELYKLLELT
ncbi:DEAD/DEAH box helicase [Chlamydiia bacterium]|nr:DEAD/DEAH box helicase [Chlamydiia bacterium]